MPFEELGKRHRGGRARFEKLGKGGRLAKLQANPQTQTNQDRTGEKRQPPAKRLKVLSAEQQPKRQEQPVGEHKAKRRAELGHHAKATAPARRRMLDREQRRPTPFAAQTKALTEPEQAQKERRHDARGCIARQERDRKSGRSHQQQRCDER